MFPLFPTQPILTYVNIAGHGFSGANLYDHINQIRIYESMDKCYHTCSLRVLDNNLLFQNIVPRGGQTIKFSFNCGENISYDGLFYIHTVHSEQQGHGGKAVICTIDGVGVEWYSNEQSTVKEQFQGTVTGAIQKVADKYLGLGTRILRSSAGPIDQTGFNTNRVQPIRMISDLCRRANFGGSGNCLFFKDRNSAVCGPLKAVFDNMGTQWEFVQDLTIGADWKNDVLKQESIIMACLADYENRGSVSAASGVGAGNQNQVLRDMATKKKPINIPSGKVGNLLSFIPGIAENGAFANFSTFDSKRTPLATTAGQKHRPERLEAAQYGLNPSLLVKVPLRKALYCTVGKGISLRLLPAQGDYPNPIASYLSGDWLVDKLCYRLYLDDKTYQGDATFNVIKKDSIDI